jgi:hypothetical protein
LPPARVRILSVEAIGARVDQRLRLLTGGARDLPERQQTLRGAIDWSYDLLEEPDRRMFDRFSVFSGGAYLMQAEPVCGPPPELGTDVLDGLSSLADKSLVRGTPTAEQDPRFVMLATIREYGQEKLAADGDLDDLRARHAATFVALVEQAQPHLTSADAPRWLDRLDLDHDNIRAAFEWAVESGNAEVAFRLLAAIWRFWQIRGYIYEGRRRTDAVLAMAGASDLPALLRARALGAGGSICYWQSDFVPCHNNYAAALAAAREAGDEQAVAEALYNLSFAPLEYLPESRGDILKGSIPYLEEAADAYERLGDQRGVSDANWALGFALLSVERFDDAERHGQLAFEVAHKLNDPFPHRLDGPYQGLAPGLARRCRRRRSHLPRGTRQVPRHGRPGRADPAAAGHGAARRGSGRDGALVAADRLQSTAFASAAASVAWTTRSSKSARILLAPARETDGARRDRRIRGR